MCIRDSYITVAIVALNNINDADATAEQIKIIMRNNHNINCLLYTSDAADERSSVDLGGRRIIKQKNILTKYGCIVDYKKNRKRKLKHRCNKKDTNSKK